MNRRYRIASESRQTGGLSIVRLSNDDISAPVICQVEGCNGMALQRIAMAGYPAGEVCSRCAKEWATIWAEATETSPVKVPKRLARAA